MDIKVNGKEFRFLTRIEVEPASNETENWSRIWLWRGDEIIETMTSPVTIEAL